MRSISDLRREVGSLEVLINLISDELDAARNTPATLAREMQEALEELRLARAYRKILLTAFDDNAETSPERASNIRPSSLTPAA
ncbi:MAG TPA: hypothetical protein VJQ56_02460 [Blastocatellia bacterium]|nr:hypothetical protein [Blastocatellia bacterium]